MAPTVTTVFPDEGVKGLVVFITGTELDLTTSVTTDGTTTAWDAFDAQHLVIRIPITGAGSTNGTKTILITTSGGSVSTTFTVISYGLAAPPGWGIR